MKAIRYLAYILGGLLLLAVIGMVILVATFDANKWKGEIEQIVKEKKNRTLHIGDLSLSFWPGLGVKVEDVSVSEFGNDKPFASLKSARVAVALLPLLSGEAVVDTIILDGADATLIRDKNGKLNIDDLLTREEEPPPKQDIRFEIDGIKISDTRLAWVDEQTGKKLALSDLNLSTGHIAPVAEGKLNLSTRIEGQAPSLLVKLEAAGHYRLDLNAKQYGVSSLDVGLQGDVAGLKGLDLSLSADNLALKPDAGAVDIEALKLAAKGQLSEDPFELEMTAPKLAVTADKASGETIKVSVNVAGKARKLDAKLVLSGLEGSTRALSVAKLALDVDAAQADAKLKGGLTSPLTANLSAQVVDLSKIVGEFEIAHPQMPMKQVKLPLSGSVHADIVKQNVHVNIATKLDDSNIQAKVGATSFSPLALVFDVDVDKLNIDKYFPPKDKNATKGSGEPHGAAVADTPVDLSPLKGINASGSLRVGALQVSNIKARNVHVELKAKDGKAMLAPLSANLYEGTLAGSLGLNAHDNSIAVRQTLTNVNINPLMKDVIDKDLLEGRGNVALDVTAVGKTVGTMKRALAGNANVRLNDGAIKGINLAKVFRETKAKFFQQQDAVERAASTEKTDFSEFIATFKINKGVAHNDDMLTKSPFFRLTGAGDLDIGNGTMNYLAKASIVSTSTGQGGKDLEHLKGLTVPVRVTGTFDNLAYKLELEDLAKEVAKEKFEEKKDEVREKVKEKLFHKLFGR